MKAAVDDRGRLRSIIENIVDPGPIAPAAISSDAAIGQVVSQ